MATPMKHVRMANSPEEKSVRVNVDKKIIDNFWTLCDGSTEKRIESSQIIIDVLTEELKSNQNSGLNYCVDRLVRGMGSSRKFARQGFATLLSWILHNFDQVTISEVYEKAQVHLGKTNENKDHQSVIGWVFIFGSLVKSQKLNLDQHKNICIDMFETLYNYGSTKSYVELAMCEVLKQLFDLFLDKKDSFNKLIWKNFESKLEQEENLTPISLFIYLIAIQIFPDFKVKNDKLKNCLDKNYYQNLAKIVQDTTKNHPFVHQVNIELIKIMIQKNEFNNFWHKVIDESLFQPGQIEKGFLGFELIKTTLPMVQNKEQLSVLISPLFLRLFIQTLSFKQHNLHKAAQELANFFINFIKNCDDESFQIGFANCFIEAPGSLMFDSISRDKFFSSFISNFKIEAVKSWIKKLKSIYQKQEKIDNNDSLRIACIVQMSTLAKADSVKEDYEWLCQMAKFFLFQSYFQIKEKKDLIKELKPTKVPVSDKLKHSCQDAFRKTIAYISRVGTKTTKERFIRECETLLIMVNFADELIHLKNLSFTFESTSFTSSWNRLNEKLKILSKKLKKDKSKENEIMIFQLLFSIFAINLFEDYAENDSLLNDIEECMNRALNDKTEENSLVWSDVILDLMLSLLPACSKLTRNIFVSTFEYVCPYITEEGLQQLINSISSTDLGSGDHDSDVDEESDVGDEEKENQHVDEDDKSSSESSSESENEENLQVDEEFRLDVRKALGDAAESDEESVYLSDSQMYQFDEALAEVFRSKLAAKKQSKQKENHLLIFRLRAFDFVQIYLNQKEPKLEFIIKFIEPLTNIAKSTVNVVKLSQLASKAIQTLQKIPKIKNFQSKNDTIELSELKNLTKKLVKILKKDSNSQLKDVISKLCIWILNLSKCYHPNDTWYISKYTKLLKEIFEKNYHPSLSFFLQLIQASNEVAFYFFQVLKEYSFHNGIRNFKRIAGFELILASHKALIKSQTIDKEEFNKSCEEIFQKCITSLNQSLNDIKAKGGYVGHLVQVLEQMENHFKETKIVKSSEYQELLGKLRVLPKDVRKKFSKASVKALRKVLKSV